MFLPGVALILSKFCKPTHHQSNQQNQNIPPDHFHLPNTGKPQPEKSQSITANISTFQYIFVFIINLCARYFCFEKWN